MPPQQTQTIEETLAPWIGACPAIDHPDCQYAEVVVKIHQGRITTWHVTVKHILGTSPPREAETATATTEPSDQ